MFKLARRTRRVKRLYVYTWFGNTTPGFDSGLVARGRGRRAFKAFRQRIRSTPRGVFAR
jgi:hypothetical protein